MKLALDGVQRPVTEPYGQKLTRWRPSDPTGNFSPNFVLERISKMVVSFLSSGYTRAIIGMVRFTSRLGCLFARFFPPDVIGHGWSGLLSHPFVFKNSFHFSGAMS